MSSSVLDYQILIEKPASTPYIGLLVSYQDGGFEVKTVFPGPVEEWNRGHPWQAVDVGDQMVAVNGVFRPTVHDLTDAVETNQHLVLKFVRFSVASEFITM
mmetsp:Transcript_28096/g.74291  ORF Transcript_28096/g.74291 Transcript_28096/m.74291 type:complete len:101 (-) Transcript_28096:195-497(-)